MFVPVTHHTIACDAPDCTARIIEGESEEPLLMAVPDLDAVPDGYLTDEDGTPWTRWGSRIMCPRHGHLLEREQEIVDTHDALF